MNHVYTECGNLTLGFHGCDKKIAEKLLNSPNAVRCSNNSYDWLGSGFYVWENNLERAQEWAKSNKEDWSVVGVVYSYGNCLDTMNSECIKLIEEYYKLFINDCKLAGKEIPRNNDAKRDENCDKLLRFLDCAVVNYINERIDVAYLKNKESKCLIQPFDTVRGAFFEGGPIYDGACIYKKSHIQVCIRNMNCIKGFFKPRELTQFPI